MLDRNAHARPSWSLSRRSFMGVLGGVAALFAARGAGASTPLAAAPAETLQAANAPYTLPPLPYAYNALEPHIDEMTMRLHHTRHHNAFIAPLNSALQNYPDLQMRSLTDLLVNINDIPEDIRTVVRNNGGGFSNHDIFWAIMGPNAGGAPSGALAQAINATFGSFDSFKQQVYDAGLRRFGSGWSWLVLDSTGKLQVLSTANQDSPYMQRQTPLLGIDVWEHAYYLKYNNRRADYINTWWNVVNWDAVQQRFERAQVEVR